MTERYVAGETTFDPQGDMTTAKVNALPAVAKDLGREIVRTVVEYW